jgi:hypothetical protein
LVSSYYAIIYVWVKIWHGLAGKLTASGRLLNTLVAHVVQSIFDTPVQAPVVAEQYDEQ